MGVFRAVLQGVFLVAFLFVLGMPSFAYDVVVQQDSQGYKLLINNQPFFVKGVNWLYLPHGSSRNYDFWKQDEAFIKQVLDYQMSMLVDLGVNTVILESGVPIKWISYLYQEFGLYTIIQYPFYGFDFSYQEGLDRMINDIRVQSMDYASVSGFLFLLLGHDSHFSDDLGTFYSDDLDEGKVLERQAALVYSVYGDVIESLSHLNIKFPIAVVGLPFVNPDLINQYCPNADVFSASVYHGKTFSGLFQRLNRRLDMPVFLHGMGSDSYHAKKKTDDHVMQALYLKEQWRSLYLNAYGMGEANSVGAAIRHFGDRRYLLDSPESYGTEYASWSEIRYGHDFDEVGHNMNDGWFGIVAKASADYRGFYRVVPRTSFYVLQKIFSFNRFKREVSNDDIKLFWDDINPEDYSYLYNLYLLDESSQKLSRVYFQKSRIYVEYGGRHGFIADEERVKPFDYTQSLYTTLVLNPTTYFNAEVDVNIVGNVSQSRLYHRFYESYYGEHSSGVSLYRVLLRLEESYFNVLGFYRESFRLYWNYDDLFQLLPDHLSSERLDIYYGKVPNMFMLQGKRMFNNLSLLFGPEVYWGANPMLFLSYRINTWIGELTSFLQYDGLDRASYDSIYDVGQPKTTKIAFQLKQLLLGFTLNMGILASGFEELEQSYYTLIKTDEDGYLNSGYDILTHRVDFKDLLGGKVYVERRGRLGYLFLDMGYLGLLAKGGYSPPEVDDFYDGLKPVNRGNQRYIHAGFSLDLGPVSFSPSMIYQKPLVGPKFPKGDASVDWGDDRKIGLRNSINHIFSVLDNRYLTGGEFWISRRASRETFGFSGRLGAVYRYYRTATDGFVSVNDSGDRYVVGAIPSAKLYDGVVDIRFQQSEYRQFSQLYYAGYSQSRGASGRMIKRGGVSSTFFWDRLRVDSYLKFYDFGPYYTYADQGLTYPFQFMISCSIGKTLAIHEGYRTEYGVVFRFRSLDQYSLSESNEVSFDQFSFSTYLQIAL